MPYAEVEINLDELKDKIKYFYCENGNCLLKDAPESFKMRFMQYVKDLRFDIELRKQSKNVKDILRDLENFADMLKE